MIVIDMNNYEVICSDLYQHFLSLPEDEAMMLQNVAASISLVNCKKINKMFQLWYQNIWSTAK